MRASPHFKNHESIRVTKDLDLAMQRNTGRRTQGRTSTPRCLPFLDFKPLPAPIGTKILQVEYGFSQCVLWFHTRYQLRSSIYEDPLVFKS